LVLVIVVTSIYLVLISQSKRSLGCAVIAGILATLVLFVGKKLRVSPAILLSPLLIGYALLSATRGSLIESISWHILLRHNWIVLRKYQVGGRALF
jgi:hypothetical protein